MLSTILYTISCFIKQSIINSSNSGILDENVSLSGTKRVFGIHTPRSYPVYGGKDKTSTGLRGIERLILNSTVYLFYREGVP